MQVSKVTIYRLVASADCGCRAEQEYVNGTFKEVSGAKNFTACDKHKVKATSKLLLELLGERLEEEVQKMAKALPQNQPKVPILNEESTDVRPVSTRQENRVPLRRKLDSKIGLTVKSENSVRSLGSVSGNNSGVRREYDSSRDTMPRPERTK